MAKRKARPSVVYLGESGRLFVQRIGKTPAQRLAWVIRFAQIELSLLRPEERIALARDLSLFQSLSTIENPRPLPDVTLLKEEAPIPSDAELRSIQEHLAEGLRGLMKAKPWALPNARSIYVYYSSPEKPGGPQFKMVWFGSGDAKEAVLSAVARLLVEYGGKVRACPECRKIFIATRRQEYCDTRCSQRVRNYRRKLAEAPK